MRWRRVDPVQPVGALMMTGPAAADRLASALAGKSALFHALPVEQGEGWAVVFAGRSGPGDDALLPRLDGALPLYEAASGCWLPVGLAVDAPDHVLPSLWRMAAERHEIEPPFIIIPHTDDPGAGDVYLIRDPAPFADLAGAAS